MSDKQPLPNGQAPLFAPQKPLQLGTQALGGVVNFMIASGFTAGDCVNTICEVLAAVVAGIPIESERQAVTLDIRNNIGAAVTKHFTMRQQMQSSLVLPKRPL